MKSFSFSYTPIGDDMKKIGCLLLCLLMQLQILQAESYCVLSDADNTVVAEKDMHKKQSVASISKVMTAMIALEKGNLNDTWTTGKELKQAYGSMIYLKEGQQVSLRSLLYGLMLRSGNDAALEIALHVGKTQKAFVHMMNQKAKALGMLDTQFKNPSGLDEDDGGNISSAYDMALLMSYAMKNPTFREISGSQYYTSEWNYRWKNKNKLLFEFPFAIAGKTGFTKKAGRTLISAAKHENVESVVVTLCMGDDFAFHEQQHKKIFADVEVLTILPKGTYTVDHKQIHVKQDIAVTVQKKDKEKLQIATHFDKDALIVEVRNGENQNIYNFPYKKINAHKGGFLS